MHVCKELVSTIYHESMIGFFFIDINNRLKLTYSQGHEVKKSRSNRQLCKENMFRPYIMNQYLAHVLWFDGKAGIGS